MADIQLSNNFWLSEFTRSSTAAKHGMCSEGTHCIAPTKEQIEGARETAVYLLQPIRDHLGIFDLTGGIRNGAVGPLVGTSDSSAHYRGWGVDGRPRHHPPEAVMRLLASNPRVRMPDGAIALLQWDQAILYPTHVHLGYRRPLDGSQRRQLLTKTNSGFSPWRAAA